MKALKHGKTTLKINLEKYRTGDVCIQLNEEQGEPYITLSTNLDNDLQDHEHIFVNKGDVHLEIAEKMQSLGLLIQMEQTANSGYNSYQLFKLTDSLFKRVEEDK